MIEHAAGIPVADICGMRRIHDVTVHTRRMRLGSMGISEAKGLKTLEEENCKLKKLLAFSMLDVATPLGARKNI